MEIIVKAPRGIDCDIKQWDARYTVHPSNQDTRYITVESRSSIEVVVAKVKMPYHMSDAYYYIAVPNFGVAIPGIPTLQETFWITEHLMRGMPAPDAVTVAQVLCHLEDF